MIQRIQTVFLALASLVAFVLPFVFIKYQIGENIIKIIDNLFQLLLILVAGLISAATIFKYTNRKTQVVLGRLAIIFHFIAFIWLMTDFFFVKSDANEEVYAGFGMYIPLFAIFFIVLANRYIMKDEKLVREANRLR